MYVTTLQRTHQTAAPLLAALGMEPIVEPELREVFLGDWEGGEFRKRLADGDPIAMRMAAKQRWDVIPSAEPEEVFADRVRVGIERIAAAHPDELVVAVVHGGVIGQVIAQATGARGFALHRRRQRLAQPHRRDAGPLDRALLQRHDAPAHAVQHRSRTACGLRRSTA